jgi:energy-coupling factor transporter ATP-binding protein EcfA2
MLARRVGVAAARQEKAMPANRPTTHIDAADRRHEDDRITLGRYTSGMAASLTHVDRRRHVYVVGKTGTGKSTLLKSMMLADLAAGRGFALLDPHGDLAQGIGDAVPPWRNDVVYLDPSDLPFPIGFNPLAGVGEDARPRVAANIVETFAHIWGTSLATTPRLVYILTNALRLLLDAPGSTLLGLPKLLVDERYRASLVKQCRDPLVTAFWTQEFAAYSERFLVEAVSPIQNKVGTLLSPPAIRNILGQPASTIDVRRIMDEGRVLIVNLAKGRLGADPAHLLGALLTTAFAQAAEARSDTPEDERRDFTLYADEFQHFASDAFATILSEARKWRLSLVLAHQFLGQVPDRLRQAVIGNAGSVVVFRVGAEDAPLLASELGVASPSALTEAANFSAWAKMMQDDSPTEARRFETIVPGPMAGGRLEQVRARTRARHARPRALVEDRIERFISRSGGKDR